jgi:hypothetical protein
MKDLSELWVARDKDGALFLYEAKPIREGNNQWWSIGEGSDELIEIDSDFLPELTWENSPQLVELSIKTIEKKECDLSVEKKKECDLFVGKNSFGEIVAFKTLPTESQIPGDFQPTSSFSDGTSMRDIHFPELAEELNYGEVVPMKVIIG